MKEYRLTSWRHNFPMPKPDKENNRPYPATKIFDQLTYIGDEVYACYALETSVGIILIDAMWPGPRYTQMIEQGIRDIGYEPEDVKAILITHGHPDHVGSPDYWIDHYGTKIYLSKIDHEFALNFKPQGEDRPGVSQIYKCKEINYVQDGEELTFGDTVIKAVLTPGHTPGGLSFIIPVSDEGRKHYAALWGGNGVPRKKEALLQYVEALDRFSEVTGQYRVDIELSNHPFVDMTIPRLEIIRHIQAGVAHPFIIGEEQYRRYEQMYKDKAKENLRILEENPDAFRKPEKK